jgi:D-amino-acid dehydrogenase
MTQTAVIGGGIVGICCAIALADQGHAVTLFDKDTPGRQTSRWNAGVLATSSVIPLNTPATLRNLPRLMTGRNPGFRLNKAVAATLLPWTLRFLQNCRTRPSEDSIKALTALITQSRKDHEALCGRVGYAGLRQDGWLIAYRGQTGQNRAIAQAQSLQFRDVAARVLIAAELQAFEPHLKPVFGSAVHVVQSAYTDPAALSAAYLAFAQKLGVKVVRTQVAHVSNGPAPLAVSDVTGVIGAFDQVVLALGPWTNQLLRGMGKSLPMAIERGYLQIFETPAQPTRPVYDVDGGYVAAPRPGGVQISSGTELTTLDAAPNPKLFAPVLRAAQDAIALGAPDTPEIAVGNRPSLPDGLPVIGPVSGVAGLWIAACHQHVGFSTSAGTANLLACLMTNRTPPFEHHPFKPLRFGL